MLCILDEDPSMVFQECPTSSVIALSTASDCLDNPSDPNNEFKELLARMRRGDKSSKDQAFQFLKRAFKKMNVDIVKAVEDKCWELQRSLPPAKSREFETMLTDSYGEQESKDRDDAKLKVVLEPIASLSPQPFGHQENVQLMVSSPCHLSLVQPFRIVLRFNLLHHPLKQIPNQFS
jgi:hypothetical protein